MRHLDPLRYSPQERAALLAAAAAHAAAPRPAAPVTVYGFPEEKTSPALALAFAQGAGGRLVLDGRLDPVALSHAMMPSPGHWLLFNAMLAADGPHFLLNKGYLGRGVYFRATRDALQCDPDGLERAWGDPPRGALKAFDDLDITVQPWRPSGSHILLCPNSPNWFEGLSCAADTWIEAVTQTLRAHTDRSIRVRWKRDAVRRPLSEDLRDCWAVVVFDSVAGIEAALAGIPVFATEPCAARAFGLADLSRIESPAYPGADQRRDMAAWCCASQWTLEEFRSGKAWRTLQDFATRRAA